MRPVAPKTLCASGIAFHYRQLRASGESPPETHIKTYTLAVSMQTSLHRWGLDVVGEGF